MKTTVHNKIFNLLSLTITGILMTFVGAAQTYTTQADGNWTSPATWVGGTVPSRTIAASMIVNIKHDVNCNVTGDLTISGTLNIIGDTLRFAAAFDKKTIVNAGGFLNISNGGYLQDMPSKKCDMLVNGGRLTFNNAKVAISKSLIASAGTKRFYKNSFVDIGEKYESQGSSSSRVIDTIQNTTVQVSLTSGGNYDLKSYVTLRVANAKIVVTDGDFINEINSEIIVLSNATGNYGFNLLRVKKDLENKGAWDARIDAHCIDGQIKGSNMAAIDFTRSEDCSASTTPSGAAPELVFMNPVLVSGQANKQGAVYRFNNITTGIDAEVKLKTFSRNDIVMQNIDLSGMGWEKAFQPQFGLPGVVQPWQNWYIDFEMTFYKAGTNQKQKMAKVDLTALDVDGDGWSISEYATFENPSAIIYSTVSYLTSGGGSAGLIGQSFTCSQCSLPSLLGSCSACGGDGKSGIWNIDECTACDASGLVHTLCNHPFDGVAGNTINGPVENFTNIDTLATQVMATYQYVDKDRIKFRYGARSGANSSNGSGIRLNSTWFRQFSLAPVGTLPVKISEFTATLKNADVQLKWTSEMEENFSHFVVQRSFDGKNFTDIAIVFAAGGTGIRTNYSYKDANVNASGMVYYRMLCVDHTKETAYSTTRIVRLAKDNANALTILTYPNPVQDQLKVTLPASFQGKKVMLELYNANGVLLQAIQLGAASQTEVLQMGNQSKGFYLVKATCEDQVAQQRVIKN